MERTNMSRKKSRPNDPKSDLNNFIRRANKHLLYRRFEESLAECQAGIKTAQSRPENASIGEVTSSLCMVAIQAYAELNRSQEAVPFVTSVYNGIQDCPGCVIQLCILLHAHVEEYSTSTALAQIWLGCETNINRPSYCKVTEAYLSHVILKQKQWDSVSPFLKSCPGLTREQQNVFEDYAKQVEERLAAVEAEEKAKMEAELSAQEKQKRKQTQDRHTDKDLSIPWKVMQGVANMFPKGFGTYLRKLVMFLCIVYLLVTRANITAMSYEQVTPLVVALKQLWKSLWRPLRAIR